MKNKEFRAWLESHNACKDSLAWLERRSLEEAWAECPRGDWMLWLAVKMGMNLQVVTLAKGRCAELALPFMNDDRSREAVAVAIRFGQGDASREELDKAAADADAAYAAADADAAYAAAAYAAADAAADAYTAAAAAADAYTAAAADAACAAAYAAAAADAYDAYDDAYDDADAAADAAIYAAAAAKKEETLFKCAQVCREVITIKLLTEKY